MNGEPNASVDPTAQELAVDPTAQHAEGADRLTENIRQYLDDPHGATIVIRIDRPSALRMPITIIIGA